MRKKLVILIIVVVVLLAGEAGREKAVYIVRTRTLQRSYWVIDRRMRTKEGLHKPDIQDMLGTPDKVEANDGGEMWSWSSGGRRGRLLSLLGLAPKGPDYGLDVALDKDGKVVNVFSDSEGVGR